ncbi:hypothetical protein PR048_021798 [Dryococelus australis]|uniref:Uncharacterized protein n=1 Tax=Dryococelus australis TaxID=614101 RepID=A0ABQ9GZ77_9NEOP|nr:hypothetical protein PR048_021798 [Dryococelus australis]
MQCLTDWHIEYVKDAKSAFEMIPCGWKKGTWPSEELSTKKRDKRNKTAMNNLKPPGPLLFTGNVAENYRKFKQKYELYMLALGGTKQLPEVQAAIL